jgi:hypothetical protein
MKIYIVLWKDQHSDTTAKPFTDLKEAKAWAKKTAETFGKRWPEDIKEIKVDGWLYCIQYTCEGDQLWITEHEVAVEINL